MNTHKPDQPAPAPQPRVRLPFPIVGIGAPAGGFPALATLLQNLPASPGIALVIVLHVPADQQSNADRVLQRSTHLPVVQVTHSMPILPDQVYVIPPARSLSMEDGHLVLHALERTPGDPATIDLLFRTLAMAHQEKAIGVILSGMGADGTAGLACIKEQGGVTLVQSPADARHPSMPQSAIDAGMADFVLAAADIPAKLVALRGTIKAARAHAPHGHPPGEACIDMGTDPERTLRDVLSLLHEHTGHDFRQYRRSTLLRRLERRLQVRGQPDLPSYYALQRRDASESHALFKDLLIGVTQFFRDREAFAALEHTVLPQIFQDKGQDDTVRVWVAACSTGEEAYSLAMLLADHAASMADPPAIEVFASDIDAQTIRTARAGVYPASIAEDVPPALLQRYFTMENGAYKVRKSLRRQVLFAEHNLLQEPAFSAVDLVSCRNFLIYLNQEMHRQVLDTFHFALHPGGYLMLGSAETVDGASDKFAVVDAGSKLFRAQPGPGPRPVRAPGSVRAHKVQHARAEPAGRDASPVGERPRSRGRLFSFAEIHVHKAAQQAPPSILVNANGEIVHIAAEASRFLRHAGGEPTRDLVLLVPQTWRLALRTALFQAQKSGREVSTGAVRHEQDGEPRAVDMTVLPFRDEHAEGLLMLVSFREIAALPVTVAPAGVHDQSLLERLDEELRHTRNELLETMDQAEQSNAALRTTVEELKTTAEELRSANSQLDTALETASAGMAELGTANTDLTQRLENLTRFHDDLNNLIASSDVATLFLDREMRIQRYTPRIAGLFNVIPADVGRPLLHITNRLENAHLAEEAARVFETLQPLEQEVRSKDGRDYIVRVHPYRTTEDRIGGAVMTFFDITSRRVAEKALRDSEERQAFLLRLADAVRPLYAAAEIQGEATRLLREHLAAGWCYYVEWDEPAARGIVLRDATREGLPSLAGSHDVSDVPEFLDVIRKETVLNVGDYARFDGLSPALRARYTALGFRSMLVATLVKQGHLVASLIVGNTEVCDAWSSHTEALLMEVAERTWAAVERGRAEQALRASEENYRTLFERMDEGFALCELVRDIDRRARDYRYVDLNPALVRHGGIAPEALRGRRATEFFPDLDPWLIET